MGALRILRKCMRRQVSKPSSGSGYPSWKCSSPDSSCRGPDLVLNLAAGQADVGLRFAEIDGGQFVQAVDYPMAAAPLPSDCWQT